MGSQVEVQDQSREAAFPTSYREVKIGKTLYCVTSVYKGEFELKDALEDLAVRRMLRDIEAVAPIGVS
jgi:hypothetical protein